MIAAGYSPLPPPPRTDGGRVRVCLDCEHVEFTTDHECRYCERCDSANTVNEPDDPADPYWRNRAQLTEWDTWE